MGLHIKAKLKSYLEKQLNRQYQNRLAGAKRRISYEEWLQLQKAPGDAGYRAGLAAADKTPAAGRSIADQCAAAWEQGCAMLREQGIWLIVQKGGYMDPEAFGWIADYFREHPDTQLLYGDEDTLSATGERRCSPYFKPDWSPDTWLSGFYLGSVIALRRELAQQLPAEIQSQKMCLRASEGILRFDRPGQVRLLVHQLLDLAGGFTRGCSAIAHLRGMLFHMDYDTANAGIQREYWQKDEIGRPVQIPQKFTVSVIIPSKDNPDVLEQCLESLRECQKEPVRSGAVTETAQSGGAGRLWQLEIVVVDNGSSPENKLKIEKITQGMKYIYEPAPFNFSRMCNRGAQEATGEVLLFLNDDITVNADGWLEAMAERALRPYVGAVGLKLYYPHSTTIQHVGIANLPGGPVHKLQFTQDGENEDHGYGSLDRNVIGVTGACLMVERDRFWQAGGFPEDLQVAYNDVELCFRLREAGWHNVVLNGCHAFHHESLSRGNDLTREKLQRLRKEKQTLYERHREYFDCDPYYFEPLCMELGDTHVGEIYLDTRTEPQEISRCRQLTECPEQEPEQLAYAVRPEGNTLQGYILVKWENNVCYDRCLLLQDRNRPSDTCVICLEAKYSREAEYGHQEQPNVALCGFWVILRQGLLPDGSYRVGVQARSRVGRRRLTAWTGHLLKIEGGMPVMWENVQAGL